MIPLLDFLTRRLGRGERQKPSDVTAPVPRSIGTVFAPHASLCQTLGSQAEPRRGREGLASPAQPGKAGLELPGFQLLSDASSNRNHANNHEW